MLLNIALSAPSIYALAFKGLHHIATVCFKNFVVVQQFPENEPISEILDNAAHNYKIY